MGKACIILTALPPTKGHAYLIEWARHYVSAANLSYLNILVCANAAEPMPGAERWADLMSGCGGWRSNVKIRLRIGEDPQNPGDHTAFWDYWADVIRQEFTIGPGDVLIASERYGIPLAQALDCSFVPCDIDRDIVPVSASAIRADPLRHFASILPTTQTRYRRTVTFFGAESTGKTTAARAVASRLNGHYVHEWARPFLETVGEEITDEKMSIIVHGQNACQDAAKAVADVPFVVRDTDLLSTAGYYRIYRGAEPGYLKVRVQQSRADLYVVMNDSIPFTPDRLRYGGDKRESSTRFWLDLLEEYGCSYHLVQATERGAQVDEIAAVMRADFLKHCRFAYYERPR